MLITIKRLAPLLFSLIIMFLLPTLLYWEPDVSGEAAPSSPTATDDYQGCVNCHRTLSPALVKEWETSRHAQLGIGCVSCHGAGKSDPDAWTHEGTLIATLVTPKDCGRCHPQQQQEFSGSHHAKAGEILASLDNILAERVAGMPGNVADAVSGCWQCHGSIVKFKKNKEGQVIRVGKDNKPVLDPNTWPNSGMGRLNPDGSKGSCHACHSRHAFQAKLARAPENCGKCHLGPDHPQIEIYNESKHGIAFYTNRERMALNEQEWVLGRDYSAAPTCTTCHMGAHMTPDGVAFGSSHDVGERISWTLRPVISTRLNLVIYEDGYREDYPETRVLPKVGDRVDTIEKTAEHEALVNKKVTRTVKRVLTWQQRRNNMKAVCRNCHGDLHTNNFYRQFDDLVVLYNDKFARPAQNFMNQLLADKVLKPDAPFEHEVQWVFWELWHHEGRRARHGASMMGPDYTHWHGMYEVSKHYYLKFLPEVINAAATRGPAMKKKYEKRVQEHLTQNEHLWQKGLRPEEAEALRKAYEQRYK